MRRSAACAARVAAVSAFAALSALPAHADEEGFRAMALLVSGNADGPVGELREGSFVSVRNQGDTTLADIVSPGPGACAAQWHMMRQERDGWVTSSLATYDFSRIDNVRYLADADDWDTAPSREPDDPEVSTIMLDGENWNCQQVVDFDPARPAFSLYCNSSWTLVATSPEDVPVLRTAIDRVRADCPGR